MHGGELALGVLRNYGVNEIFTLSGGHIFPFYDACVKASVPIYDVRHEQTATFAAEAMAKLTRRPGVAVLTAGPPMTRVARPPHRPRHPSPSRRRPRPAAAAVSG